jgi:hypothetical protein
MKTTFLFFFTLTLTLMFNEVVDCKVACGLNSHVSGCGPTINSDKRDVVMMQGNQPMIKRSPSGGEPILIAGSGEPYSGNDPKIKAGRGTPGYDSNGGHKSPLNPSSSPRKGSIHTSHGTVVHAEPDPHRKSTSPTSSHGTKLVKRKNSPPFHV